MNHKNNNRSSFSGKIGFVLSAAGASVGLGNIWRFPYLAAKYGGGIFLLIYIILALTFGYSMIVAETSLGRMTGKSPVGAFHSFGKSKWLSFGGWINAIIPILIVPYYSVIGGWVIKYLVEYAKGHGHDLAADGYFSTFISNGVSTELCFIVFTLCTLGIIYAGVRNGIERVSRIMMPILVVLSVVITVYSVTRPGALSGVKYFLIPNPANFSWMTVVAAMGQMFYSLSIAMGILITFGSYMKKMSPLKAPPKCRNLRYRHCYHGRSDDHSRRVRILRWRSRYLTGRSFPDVHHTSQSLRQHGHGHLRRYYVLRTGTVRSHDQLHCTYRKCCVYFRGRAWLGS